MLAAEWACSALPVQDMVTEAAPGSVLPLARRLPSDSVQRSVWSGPTEWVPRSEAIVSITMSPTREATVRLGVPVL